jgi:probable phosphoglycerate mutase
MPSDRSLDLLLIRHGETTWNREGRIQGHRDSPLTGRGLAQARAAAARLALERIGALYSSDLGRARATAHHVAAATALRIRLDEGLRERAFGVFEGKTWDEIARDHPEHARLLAEDPSHEIPGGESLAQFRERVTGAFRRIAREQASAGAIAVVTHGGVLGVLYREAMGIPLHAPRTYTTLNAGVNHFRYADDRWSVVRWGDADHLAVDDENLDDV